MPYIVVDAGHGGHDKGAHYNGYNEKDITLTVATKVTNRLRQLGFKVTQLRTDDTYVGNASARGRQIAELQPNLAISIHVNSAGGSGNSSGAEIYTPLKEDSARFEYYLKQELSRLNNFRAIYSKAYTGGKLYERKIDPDTLRYTQTYNYTDYYGIIRESWRGGVSTDIIEMFYLDNQSDLYTFLNQEDSYVEAIVVSLCKAFNVDYERGELRTEESSLAKETKKETYYRVICGSYSNLNEAKQVQQNLVSENYSGVWIQPVEMKR
jgi:N-acetylmuramoyl-L-alanine amidase